jgi:DNA segregation ATPase FtsK/SpoIIIE, S-DNA-T family
MILWEKIKARKQLVKAFKTAQIYISYSTDNGERYILPKIHSVSIDNHSTEYVFTLPTGVNPDLLRKNFYVFQQVFGKQIELDGEVKKFVLTVYNGSISNELTYRYDDIEQAIKGLKMPIMCGKNRYGEWVIYDAITEPNALISGEPGSGKSTQLRSILTTLIKYKSPAEVHFYLGDLKMSEFHLFKSVQHVKSIAVFPDELERMLSQVYNEMLKRSKLLNEMGVMHIDDLPAAKKVPYILLAIDEIVMVIDNKEVKKMLVQIDSLGRALGIYNILSLQRPSHDILDTKIRSLLTVRMGFRTPDLSNSKIIGTPGAEKISRETPGRFYLKRDTIEEIQAPYLTDLEAKKLLECYKSSEWENGCNGLPMQSNNVLTEKDVFNDAF